MCRNHLSPPKTGARKPTNWIIRLAPTPHPLRKQMWTSAALPAGAEALGAAGVPWWNVAMVGAGTEGSADRSKAAACHQVSIGRPPSCGMTSPTPPYLAFNL